MNILLINHYSGSPQYGMEFRPYYMAKEWVKAGHKVLIIGGSQSHLRKRQPHPGPETIDRIDYYWVKINPYKGNGIGRILSMALFVTQLYCRFKHFLREFKPTIVIASSTYPIDIYPARKIACYFGAKLIYEVHDLWPLSPIELGGYSKNHPFIRVMQRAEDYCYKHADGVVSMLPKAESHMIDHGLAHGKFYYVPNGIVLDDWSHPMPLPEEHSILLSQLKKKGKFIVGFTGAHGVANSLYAVIDAVSLLKDDDIVLVLVGTGQEKEKLIEYTQNKNIDNVFFLKPVHKLVIPSLLKEMDLLYIGLQKQSLFRFGISPNKMFDYMMASKPIVQAIDAGNNLVEEAKCGLYAEPENIDAIKNAILTIKNLPLEQRLLMGENGKQFVLSDHTYQILGSRFLMVMQKILER